MTQKHFLSWAYVDSSCIRLSQQLCDRNIDKIIAVGRGGYIPGVILSNLLNCKNVTVMTVKSYDDNNQQTSLNITQEPVIDKCDHILVIDDIVDSGKTFAAIKNYLVGKYAAINPDVKITFACIVYKPNELFNDVVFATRFEKADWIVFPWEYTGSQPNKLTEVS